MPREFRDCGIRQRWCCRPCTPIALIHRAPNEQPDVITTELSRPKIVPQAVSAGGVRCRQIGPADLDGVADLLTVGFPLRDRSYWVAALRYLKERDVPEGFPRYGYMLAHGDRVAGVLLLIFTSGINGCDHSVRCNVSSWYVTPEFRALAPMLVRPVLRYKEVTFINTSPADNTLPTIKAQGFERFCNGVFAAMPALTTRSWSGKAIRLADTARPQDYLPEHEVAMLRDHEARGCLSLILQKRGESYPLILRRRLVGKSSGYVRMPCAQLIYARDLECIVQLSGLIGRYLAFRGMPVLLIGANQTIAKLPGKYYEGRTPMYYRGPDSPRLADLAYTEAALFGA
jgi:hypothetical protein